jgi:hypothetical protein
MAMAMAMAMTVWEGACDEIDGACRNDEADGLEAAAARAWEWESAYAGPPDCELLPLTGCCTCHGQAYCQAPAGSRLFASARRPNETTETIPDSSASTTRASFPPRLCCLASIQPMWTQKPPLLGNAGHMVPARELATSKHHSRRHWLLII